MSFFLKKSNKIGTFSHVSQYLSTTTAPFGCRSSCNIVFMTANLGNFSFRHKKNYKKIRSRSPCGGMCYIPFSRITFSRYCPYSFFFIGSANAFICAVVIQPLP
jgi:hypothetical protein